MLVTPEMKKAAEALLDDSAFKALLAQTGKYSGESNEMRDRVEKWNKEGCQVEGLEKLTPEERQLMTLKSAVEILASSVLTRFRAEREIKALRTEVENLKKKVGN